LDPRRRGRRHPPRRAWLIEITDLYEQHWGERVRVIARRERPHPGAQLTSFDTA